MKHLEKQTNEIIDTCVDFYVTNQPEPLGSENQPHNIAKQKSIYLTKLYAVNFLKWKQRLTPTELVHLNDNGLIISYSEEELFDKFTDIEVFNGC